MQIMEITRYKFEGKEYENLGKVKDEVENRIGAILDKLDNRLTPKQAINLMKIIIEHKEELHKLLNVTFEVEGDTPTESFLKNILDLQKRDAPKTRVTT